MNKPLNLKGTQRSYFCSNSFIANNQAQKITGKNCPSP